jgi:hypothetical protein
VVSDKPRTVVASSAPIVPKRQLPKDWFLDENKDQYTYVCTNGAECGCRFYPDKPVGEFSTHDHRRVDALCLHLYGLDPETDYEDIRQQLIDIIGKGNSKSIRVPQGERYGFITFKTHRSASDAQQALDAYNDTLKVEDRILVNFAQKKHVATRKRESSQD